MLKTIKINEKLRRFHLIKLIKIIPTYLKKNIYS